LNVTDELVVVEVDEVIVEPFWIAAVICVALEPSAFADLNSRTVTRPCPATTVLDRTQKLTTQFAFANVPV
jgi:hypothetical protein